MAWKMKDVYEKEPVPDQGLRSVEIKIGKKSHWWKAGAFPRLKKIMDSKEPLIDAALKTGGVSLEETADAVSFLWESEKPITPELIRSASLFFSLLCQHAANAKRINMKEKSYENPKYQFRCLLLRIGAIGPDYKEMRRVLLDGILGNSAWLHPQGKGKS